MVQPKAGWRDAGENGLGLSKDMVARWLRPVKNNYVVIRMDVAYLTQWGSSWWMERVCGRGGIQTNCGNLWKSQKPHVRSGPGHPSCSYKFRSADNILNRT